MLNPMHKSIRPICVPNPFFEGHNTVYLIRSEPVTLIDTGVALPEAYDALCVGLKSHGISPRDVRRVLLTHKHIDHIGNAWRFQQEHDAEVFIHVDELRSVLTPDVQNERLRAYVKELIGTWGVPSDVDYGDDSAFLQHWELQPAEAQPLTHGTRLPQGRSEIITLHTPGHTIGSVCFAWQDGLFTGDHVLPDISPNIGAGDLQQPNLLEHFLNSLAATEALPDELMGCPGHGEPFAQLRERCVALRRHHADRLDEIVTLLRQHGGQTTFSIARSLFGTLEGFHVVLGCAEAASHLEYLVTDQIVIRDGATFSLRS